MKKLFGILVLWMNDKKDKPLSEFLRDSVIFLIILGIICKIFFSIGLIWPLIIFLFGGIAVVGIRHNVW